MDKYSFNTNEYLWRKYFGQSSSAGCVICCESIDKTDSTHTTVPLYPGDIGADPSRYIIVCRGCGDTIQQSCIFDYLRNTHVGADALEVLCRIQILICYSALRGTDGQSKTMNDALRTIRTSKSNIWVRTLFLAN